MSSKLLTNKVIKKKKEPKQFLVPRSTFHMMTMNQRIYCKSQDLAYVLRICPLHLSFSYVLKNPNTQNRTIRTFFCCISLPGIPHPKDAVFIMFNRQPDSNQSGLFILREVIPLLLRKVMCLPEISANEVKNFKTLYYCSSQIASEE